MFWKKLDYDQQMQLNNMFKRKDQHKAYLNDLGKQIKDK